MGRTVPTWRNRVEAELNSLNSFKRVLNPNDKVALDNLMNGVRNRRAAGGMLPSIDAWKPMLVSMLLECYEEISKLKLIIEDMKKGE